MAKDKKTSDYISIKESRAIIKDNIKKMKDETNIIEIDG